MFDTRVGWVRPALVDDEAEFDAPSPRERARLARLKEHEELQRLLGVLIMSTTLLPLPSEGRVLGPARDRDGRALRWSLWAPARRVLIDICRVSRFSDAEEQDRMAFAKTNELRYAIVEPGRRLTPRSILAWLSPEGAAS